MLNDAEKLLAEIQRLDQLLQLALNGAAAGVKALQEPPLTITSDMKAIAPGATVVVGSVDLSTFPATAMAWQVQFVSEEGSLQQCDSERFTTTAQGGAAPFAAITTPGPLVAQAGNFAPPNVAPTYSVTLVGTILTASVTNNNPANPISVRATFYADIESF